VKPEKADVLVIGGGPAGCAVSLRLAHTGCRVILLERTAYQEFRPGESLPPAAVPRLEELSVWQQFADTKPEPAFGVESAWGTSDLDATAFLTNPSLNGWHVDRLRFDAMLNSAAEAAGARVYRNAKVTLIERLPNHAWFATVASPQGELHFLSSFIVDATGRAARVCAQLRIGRRTVDSLVGIGCVTFDKSFSGSMPSRVESHPLGWWYSAGLPDGGAIVIFFTDSDLCSGYGLTRVDGWRNTLAESIHTRERFAWTIPNEPLRVFPVASHCLEAACEDSWLAVGDAVIGRDPLSSSGIDFALASAARGAGVISALANGDRTQLNAYNSAIRTDFDAYLNQRHAYYSMENRWIDSPFWQRRHRKINGFIGIQESRLPKEQGRDLRTLSSRV